MPPAPGVRREPLVSSDVDAEISQPSDIQIPRTIAPTRPPSPPTIGRCVSTTGGAGTENAAAMLLAASTAISAAKKIAVTSAVGRKPNESINPLAKIQTTPTTASASAEFASAGANRASV